MKEILLGWRGIVVLAKLMVEGFAVQPPAASPQQDAKDEYRHEYRAKCCRVGQHLKTVEHAKDHDHQESQDHCDQSIGECGSLGTRSILVGCSDCFASSMVLWQA